MLINPRKIRSSIVNYTIAHPRLNRAIDSFGKVACKATLGGYTPGLTRETFLLYQRTSPGDKIDVKADGFYRGNEKIAGNGAISKRVRDNGLPTSFLRASEDTPEIMAKYCRTNFRPLSYLGAFRRAMIVTTLFSLPDIALRIAVNLTIPASREILSCAGFASSLNNVIEWETPAQTSSFSIIGRENPAQLSPSAVEQCWNSAPKGLDIERVFEVHNNHQIYVPGGFLANAQHYVSARIDIRNLACGGLMLLMAGLVSRSAKLSKLERLLFPAGAAGALVAGFESLINGYNTDYFMIKGLVINMADIYIDSAALGAGLLMISTLIKNIKNRGAA
jgi:hypothetical protein